MKRILLLAVFLALSPVALAQLYKWVDKDGRVFYSDQPPPSQPSQQIRVAPPPDKGAPQPTAVARDKELEKGRTEAREKEKAAEEAARKSEADKESCRNAQGYLRTVSAGGRIATYDAKGEPILLDDKQLAAERVKAQKAVDEYCKGQ